MCAVWTASDLATAHAELKTILCAIELAPESTSLLKYTKEIALTSCTISRAAKLRSCKQRPAQISIASWNWAACRRRGVVNRFAGALRTEAYGIMRESPCPALSV
jgi:hypothetical protein